jgi:hypothetical protein
MRAFGIVAVTIAGALGAWSIARAASAPQSQAARPASQPLDGDAKIIADFVDRVRAYLELRKKASGGLKGLPENATPQEIDARQRQLGAAVIAVRKGARTGEIFGQDMTRLIKRNFGTIFKGDNGKILRASIFEEPHPAVPAVNVRYPDAVPLSTMPPDVLKVLPKLQDALEFRFIGHHLILLDVEAHLVVDVLPNAIPAG